MRTTMKQLCAGLHTALASQSHADEPTPNEHMVAVNSYMILCIGLPHQPCFGGSPNSELARTGLRFVHVRILHRTRVCGRERYERFRCTFVADWGHTSARITHGRPAWRTRPSPTGTKRKCEGCRRAFRAISGIIANAHVVF